MNEISLLRHQIAALTAERDRWMTSCEFAFEQRDKLSAQIETLQYEVDAIPAIKADRDAYEKCADTMAAAHKVERDALKAELARPESTAVSLMRAENAALKDAARLALDALERLLVCSDACTCSGREAIASLKAVLK